MEEKIPQENKPDWVIGDLYRQAWEIIKKHKVLWVFVMAAGSGMSLNSFINSFDASDISKFLEKLNGTQQTGSEITRVLGTSTSYITETISYFFSATPISFYIILAIEFLFLICVGVAINIVYTAWATGSLLSGIQTAIAGDKPTIKDSSAKAIRRIKPLIWLAIVPLVVLATLAIIAASLLFFADMLIANNLYGFVIFLFIPLVIVFILALFILSLTLIWAQRQVVVDNKGGKEALFAGFKMIKKKFWAMLLLGIVNNILILLVVGIPIGIIAGILIGGLFTVGYLGANTKTLVWIIASFAILIVILFAFVAPILGGIINAFKATVWSLAYNNIRGKYDK